MRDAVNTMECQVGTEYWARQAWRNNKYWQTQLTMEISLQCDSKMLL